MAVGDPTLRVSGTGGGPIANASIMRFVADSDSISACGMIGEKAATLIHDETAFRGVQ
jgi:hypothetical protein